MSVDTLPPLPSYDDVQVVVPAPGAGPGNWAGAASAVLVDGTFWLTYRVRRPLTEGRGVSVVVARSRRRGAPSSRSPSSTARRSAASPSSGRCWCRVPGVGWRLYLSCATPDSKHWWVDSLTAATPEELPRGERRVVLPGDDRVAVKDPVVEHDRPTAGGCGCAATR